MSEYSDVEITKDNEEIFQQESPQVGKKITAVPKPPTNIGIDINDEFFDNIIEYGESSAVDINQINSFTQLSQSRETLYDVLDAMAEDPTIAAMLETYAEDATETNDQGRIVWCEASDARISKYVTFLLDSLNIDKNIYRWVYSLCQYGDIYLKLFRRSDFEDTLLDDSAKTKLNESFNRTQEGQDILDENVVIKAYDNRDRLADYIDIVPNPAEMFELTKFGKSYAYIKTNTLPQVKQNEQQLNSSHYLYKLNRSDVEIYNAVSFVHGALQDNTPRMPEEVQIFNTADPNSEGLYTYTVRRGQSILYNAYKIWRQMMLLENALLLNRLTKSSILRVIEVEVADMPKEKVRERLQRIKTLVEQKASFKDGDFMSEYTNPGAMENNIYVPTKNGVGAISTQQIGGDVNVRDIADIDYFKNKFFSSMKIPKMFFGETDDAAGFNGGTSLSIISSRYAKTVKRIQSVMVQTLTDAINILLLDRGLDSYVNRFKLHMQPPVTQEELDKRDAQSSEIQLTNDVMNMLGDIEDPILKFKILKSLLSQAITNVEVIDLLQEVIDDLEASVEEEAAMSDDLGDDFGGDFSGDFGGDFGGGASSPDLDDFGGFESGGGLEVGPESEGGDGGDVLPTPADLGAGDFTNM